MKKIIFLALIVFAFALFTNCGEAPKDAAVSCEANGDTPTEAYKRLFAAVKAKNTEAIKAELTQATVELGKMSAERYKKTIESAYENGFSNTTFAPTLPEMRDERVDCNMGAVEVWSAKDQRWEDVPFMLENGKWKLATGDLFRATYKSPGKGLAIREAEAVNAARGNVTPNVPSANTMKRTSNIANVPVNRPSANAPAPK